MSDHLIAEANRHARALIIERDQIRTELALLREWQREVIQNANAHHAERREAIARAERAEAELKEWSLLNLWGGTPEIIHAFVKGQQARIHAAQDLEAELDATKERALTLANLLDQAQTELAELKESVLVQQIFSDDRIRANAAEAELAGIRALADRRNKRYHVEDTTHQLVAALDQALDIAQAELADLKANNRFQRGHSAGFAEAKADCATELATERARLRQLALDACRAAAIVPLVWYPTGYYVNPNDLGKINKQQVDACVAAIDAAMKEDA